MNRIEQIAAIPISSTQIRIIITGSYTQWGPTESKVYGVYTKNDGMTWQRIVSHSMYDSSLFGRNFGSTPYLMYFAGYMTQKIQRQVAPNGAIQSEIFGNDPNGNPYTNHAYYVPAPIYAWDSFSSIGMDYSSGQSSYYGLDTCSNAGINNQCIVRIPDADVVF